MKNKGFTLVELLVVIVIIGILAAAAISVFGGGTDKAKLNTTKNDVAAFHSAGTLAIADQGWDAGRTASSLVTEGYLSELSSNSYATGVGTSDDQPWYVYAAKRVTSGQSTNPVVYAAGYIDATGESFTYEKGGSGAITVTVNATTGQITALNGSPETSQVWNGTDNKAITGI